MPRIAHGSFVLSGHVNDSVGIDIECDLDLGDTLGCGRNTDQLEVSEHLVVSYQFSLTLENLDVNSSLSIGSGREDG